MKFDEPHEIITGLEDDDNYFDIVRMRAGLTTRDEATKLVQDVVLYISCGLSRDTAHEFLNVLPRAVEEHVYPRLDYETCEHPSLTGLERQIEDKWSVELDQAARFVAAVGLSTVERLGFREVQNFRTQLPGDLQFVFPDKISAVA